MPREFSRNQRVAELIKKELAILIQRQFSAREFGMITLSAVSVSPDLMNAKVFVTCLESDKSHDDVIATLNTRAGQLRHELSKTIIARRIPRLSFLFDESVERGQYLSSLIDSLRTGAKNRNE